MDITKYTPPDKKRVHTNIKLFFPTISRTGDMSSLNSDAIKSPSFVFRNYFLDNVAGSFNSHFAAIFGSERLSLDILAEN